jgi:hypothetical protein
MHVRSKINLDIEMLHRARVKAAEEGISFAEYVRRLVARDLGEPKPNVDVSIVFDLCDSGEPTNIARDKDEMIGQAAWEEHLRKTGRRPRHRRSHTKTGR